MVLSVHEETVALTRCVMDVVYIGLTLVLFGVTALLIRLCERV